jgi:hypothetical protein
MTIIIVALMLNFANVIGYNKCQSDARNRLQQFGARLISWNFLHKAANAIRNFFITEKTGHMEVA